MTITPMLRISLLAGAAMAMAAPAAADVKAGVDAWSRGEYARAVAEWRVDAERGDADAQFNLGQAYKLGRGVPADLSRAEELFGKAAAQGHLQAADNYGLLLFQRGDHARAMPYIKAASDRGDPRAEYLLGLAYFNGDNIGKDWVRAYALVSLARQSGLPQAARAQAQMDGYIPLDQRQRSVALASQLADQARETRERQVASADLGVTAGGPRSPAPTVGAGAPALVSARSAVAAAGGDSPRDAGADYARPHPSEAPAPPRPVARTPTGAPHPAPAPSPPPPVHERPAPATASARPAASGGWRVQLGAFGVPGNAEALWNRVKTRPELSGHDRLLVPAGKVSKLQAGGFASEAEAQAACSRLTSGGFACIATRN